MILSSIVIFWSGIWSLLCWSVSGRFIYETTIIYWHSPSVVVSISFVSWFIKSVKFITFTLTFWFAFFGPHLCAMLNRSAPLLTALFSWSSTHSIEFNCKLGFILILLLFILSLAIIFHIGNLLLLSCDLFLLSLLSKLVSSLLGWESLLFDLFYFLVLLLFVLDDRVLRILYFSNSILLEIINTTGDLLGMFFNRSVSPIFDGLNLYISIFFSVLKLSIGLFFKLC